MVFFTVYLSDGRVMNSKDYDYPGKTSPWLIIVDLLNNQNLYILKKHFNNENATKEDLLSQYSLCPHDLKPKLIRITNIQLNVNGIVYNSASLSKRSRFQCKEEIADFLVEDDISYFWVYGMSDWEFLNSNQQDNYISFSFLVNSKYRIFQWINTKTNESHIEICDYSDTRNIKVIERLI